MNRRQFLRRAAIGVAATSVEFSETSALEPAKGVNWPIGCFNRPWTKWSFDETLDGIKAAGYKLTGLLSRTREEPFIGAEATPEYLEGLKKRIAARGLKANMAMLRSRHDIPLEDAIRDLRKQIDHARILSLQYVLTVGVDKPAEFDHFYRVMADAAPYAEERGIKLAVKPHGGVSAAGEDLRRCIEKVNHRNFGIWYDAGNIIYYTSKDPVEELKPIARHVTGFCAKDCDQPKGQVMMQFGAGKVDFQATFRALKAAGFNGPVMVECCAPGQTPEEVTANARANREFLERIVATL
ncbi:MAG TPA: sugar phosphate isomerase/epimerase [Blastocatellia bacterium]|nr:sugar phosphate isomerase/epimerase [Blastocatellia bacterium]